MGQAGGMVCNHVLIEEHGPWHMAAGIFLSAIALLGRQIPGGINNFEFRCSQLFLNPIGIDHEAAFFCAHFCFPYAASPGVPKRIRKRRFSLPFFSILAM